MAPYSPIPYNTPTTSDSSVDSASNLSAYFTSSKAHQRAANDESRPTSEALALEKDERASRRSRHMSKEAAQVARRKARKEKAQGLGDQDRGSREKPSHDLYAADMEDSSELDSDAPIPSAIDESNIYFSTASNTALLVDILPSFTASRKEKPRRKQADTFDIIPPVPTVIILEDADFQSNDAELDEPWELVSDTDGDVDQKVPGA